MSGIIHRGDDLYANADWSEVVPAGSAEAAFLLVAAGGTVPRERLDLYRTVVPDAVPVDEGERTVRIGGEKHAGAVTAKPKVGEPAEPVAAVEVAVGETGELDGDGTSTDAGQVVNLDELDKAQLLDYAEEHGIEVNRRLGVAKLREAISAAPVPPVVAAD